MNLVRWPIVIVFFTVSIFTLPVIQADYKAAIKAYVTKDYKTAFKLLVVEADKGDQKALFSLGLLYYNGQGVEKNGITAQALFVLAKDRKSKRAQSYIDALAPKLVDGAVEKGIELATRFKPGNIREILGLEVNAITETTTNKIVSADELLPEFGPPDGIVFHEVFEIPEDVGKGGAWEPPPRDTTPFDKLQPPLNAPEIPKEVLSPYPGDISHYNPEQYSSLTPAQAISSLGDKQLINLSPDYYIPTDGSPVSYKKQLLNGIVTQYCKDYEDKINEVQEYKDGLQHGLFFRWRSCDPTGKPVSYVEIFNKGILKKRFEFNDGKLVEVKEYDGIDKNNYWEYDFNKNTGKLSQVINYKPEGLLLKINISKTSVSVYKYAAPGDKSNNIFSNYQKGMLANSGSNKDGKKDGLFTEYRDGKLTNWAIYKAGKRHGPRRTYGIGNEHYLNDEALWSNEKRNGPMYSFNKDGTIRYYALYKDGKLNGLVANLDKEQSRSFWKDGKKDGPSISFKEDGSIYYIEEYRAGKYNGRYISYGFLKGGGITKYIEYKDDEMTGRYISYGKDSDYEGKPYSHTIESYNKNLNHGPTMTYHSNGKVNEERPFKDNEQHGVWKRFDKNGVISEEETFSNGQRKGIYRIYSDGKLLKEEIR